MFFRIVLFICLEAAVGFLRQQPVHRIARRLATKVAVSQKPFVLFDGDCHVCDMWVNFLLENDGNDEYCFAALRSEQGEYLLDRSGLKADEFSTMVVVDSDGAVTSGSDALLRLGSTISWKTPETKALLPPLCHIVQAIIPKPIRDAMLDFVWEHRFDIFGHPTECSLDSFDRFDQRFISLDELVATAGTRESPLQEDLILTPKHTEDSSPFSQSSIYDDIVVVLDTEDAEISTQKGRKASSFNSTSPFSPVQ